jgi:hypothetical protein
MPDTQHAASEDGRIKINFIFTQYQSDSTYGIALSGCFNLAGRIQTTFISSRIFKLDAFDHHDVIFSRSEVKVVVSLSRKTL